MIISLLFLKAANRRKKLIIKSTNSGKKISIQGANI